MTAHHLFHIQTSSEQPIYRQLTEQIEDLVAGGKLKPGDALPSVRQLSQQLEINPMTVSKAYSLLEQQGVLDRQRGKGMVIAQGAGHEGSASERIKKLAPLFEGLAQRSRQLRLNRQQILQALEAYLEE